ncbi:Protein RETICULATA-RELATED 3, chloroplastic [Dionaea muscipula]
MATMAQLRFSPLFNSDHFSHNSRSLDQPPSIFLPHQICSPHQNLSLTLRPGRPDALKPYLPCSVGGNGDIGVGGRGSGGGGGWSGGGEEGGFEDSSSSIWEKLGILGLLIKGWKSRVAADPQFPFKVLMEELVGVTACVLGDMASRPNFGLNELDFVFSTLVVGSILNFALMYILAPTLGSSSSSSALPWIFASCPSGHMFEPGPYGLLDRYGTFVYKGIVFAGVGFAAGLVGTAVSNGLIAIRKKMDPNFETPNKPPPTLLNAFTWALHMGLSSNFRYQTLNGIEFVMAKAVPPFVFKTSVLVLRCLNNVLGGMSFVVLARITGSQTVDGAGAGANKGQKLMSYDKDLPSTPST